MKNRDMDLNIGEAAAKKEAAKKEASDLARIFCVVLVCDLILPVLKSVAFTIVTWLFAVFNLSAAEVSDVPPAALPFDYQEGERSTDLVTPEAVAGASALLGEDKAAQLIHAMSLQMAKYDRDMATKGGRTAWHGRLVSEVVDTNALVKVEVYSNEVTGATWRYRTAFKPPAPKSRPRAVALDGRGVPARLAEARARRAAELNAGVVETSVVVNAVPPTYPPPPTYPIETPPVEIPDADPNASTNAPPAQEDR